MRRNRPMEKTVRIGSGLGFYGDSWEPVVASVLRGGVHYIASDHLAELTSCKKIGNATPSWAMHATWCRC